MLQSIQVTQLANGLRVVTLPKKETEAATVSIYTLVGSRNEPEALNGASHFIEHMLFKGTPKRSAKAISQAIEGQGGNFNAFTTASATCYYAKVPYNKVGLAVDVLSDLFYNASFDPEDFACERRVIIEEIRMHEDMPEQVAFQQLTSQLWSGHPLGRPISGTIETVSSMTREQVLAYRAQQYAPSRTVFAFTGRVNHEACVKAVEKVAGHLTNPEHLRSPEPYSRVIPTDPFSLVKREISQTHIGFGWRVPESALNPKDRAVLSALSCVTGETMMSRLYQSIRERRGLCYSIISDVLSEADCDAFLVLTGCDYTKALSGAKAILNEIARLKARPIPAAELRRTRDYLCGRFRMTMSGAPMLWISRRLLTGESIDPAAELDLYRSITPEEIHALAQALFTSERMVMSVVEPEKVRTGAARWAALLKQI